MAAELPHAALEAALTAAVIESGYTREQLVADLAAATARVKLLRSVLAAHPDTLRRRHEQTLPAMRKLFDLCKQNAAFAEQFCTTFTARVRIAARYTEYQCCVISEVRMQFTWTPRPGRQNAAAVPDRAINLQLLTGRRLCAARLWQPGRLHTAYCWDVRFRKGAPQVVKGLQAWAASNFGVATDAPEASFLVILHFAHTDLTVAGLAESLAALPDVAWPNAFDGEDSLQ